MGAGSTRPQQDIRFHVLFSTFDDLRMLENLSLPLTTVHVSRDDMRRLAAEMLIRQIEGRGDLPPEKASLQAPLVVRRSTRPLRAD